MSNLAHTHAGWQNSRAARHAQEWVWQNLLATTLAPTAATAPFAQMDWPNPRGAARVQVQQVFGEPLTLRAEPFRQNDWSNPVLAGRVQPQQLGDEVSIALQYPLPTLPPELQGRALPEPVPPLRSQYHVTWGSWGAEWLGNIGTYAKNAPFYLEIGSGLSIMLGAPRFAAWNTLGRPASPKDYECGFNVDTSKLEMWNGVAWVGVLLS